MKPPNTLLPLAGGLALCGIGALASACAPLATEDAQTPDPSPPTDGPWEPPEPHTGDLPAGEGTVEIRGVGTFSFDAGQVSGAGIDIVGPFQFTGRLEVEGGVVALIKQYLGKHRVDYVGEFDGEGTLHGTWPPGKPKSEITVRKEILLEGGQPVVRLHR